MVSGGHFDVENGMEKQSVHGSGQHKRRVHL